MSIYCSNRNFHHYVLDFLLGLVLWGDDEVLEMKRRMKKLGGYANDNVNYSFETHLILSMFLVILNRICVIY